ncbi:MAG TPA: MoaD/ThiS family protein [Woeseiaceae bacterium]
MIRATGNRPERRFAEGAEEERGQRADPAAIRVVLPQHLRTLARVEGEVRLEVPAPVTMAAVLDALEAGYPMLCGTIRDHVTRRRRPLVRFFACAEDVSHEPPDAPLPPAVVTGAEPFYIVGAIAGG